MLIKSESRLSFVPSDSAKEKILLRIIQGMKSVLTQTCKVEGWGGAVYPP